LSALDLPALERPAKAIPMLRARLHVEIDLQRKNRGIAIQPHW
jgi:hypothetical protein